MIKFFVALVMFLCGMSPVMAGDYDINRRVNAYAYVLTEKQITSLEYKIIRTENAANDKAQIVALVIPFLPVGEDINSFTNAAFKKARIGAAGKDNGVLLVISINDRKMRIEVGYGLEGSLTDLHSADILNGMKPFLQRNDYYSAISYAIDEIGKRIAVERSATGTANVDAKSLKNNEKVAKKIGQNEEGFGVMGFIFILVGFVLCVMFIRKMTKARVTDAAYGAIELKKDEPDMNKFTVSNNVNVPKREVVRNRGGGIYTDKELEAMRRQRDAMRRVADTPKKSDSDGFLTGVVTGALVDSLLHSSPSRASSSSSESDYSPPSRSSSSYDDSSSDSSSSWSGGGGESGGGGSSDSW